MTNHRRRMQTRTRDFSIRIADWPDEHNRAVKTRKAYRRLDRAARDATRQYRRLAASALRVGDAMRGHAAALTIRDEIRDFTAERAGLDRIANNGWDVSEEYAALAAEEAAYNEHREDTP